MPENQPKEIVGIANCDPEQSQGSFYHTEIYVRYVLPQHQNQGVGRKLARACVQYFQQQLKAETMLIWVIAENPYRRFYESVDGKLAREKPKSLETK